MSWLKLPSAALALLAALALAAASPAPALAAGPYQSGSTGYDLGWPNCGSSYPAGSFVVAGVSHGRPFDVSNGTPNPCLYPEYSSSANHALYLNTGYDPVYYSEHATADCIQRSAGLATDTAHQQAWAIGCSWAELQAQYAYSVGARAPTAWWLDVETGNSWSSSDLTLNAATLQGGVDELSYLTPSIPTGVYSNRTQWSQIVGANAVTGLAADWVATGASTARRAARYCSTGFSGQAVWLTQWVTRLDHDYAC